MSLDAVQAALLASYEADGGINHLDGVNLPAQESVNTLARDVMHLLFPGYFEEIALEKSAVPAHVGRLLAGIERRLTAEIEKCLRFARRADAATRAPAIATQALGQFPELRRIIQTDVTAAYEGDPAARSVEEIILSYPCVLVISLQRFAHVLYHLGVPLLPRMLTEYAHERTGTDIHPGARIGTHFFIDHATGVVIGESCTIGNHVKIYQGVTLGAKSFEVDNNGHPIKGVKRHPDIEDHVTIYAHATILGGDTRIGAHSIVGGNVWLLQSVPAHSIVQQKGDNLLVRARRKKEPSVAAPAQAGAADDWVI
ncbi:MAG: serine acetyltransferase [Undibacterium sp.]|nr:serine acetyltransferase [Opitutaceae bacterium]